MQKVFEGALTTAKQGLRTYLFVGKYQNNTYELTLKTQAKNTGNDKTPLR